MTYYVLFFLHLETRRASLAGITRHPTEERMTQMARNAVDVVQQKKQARSAERMVRTVIKARRWCALLCSRITYRGESRDQGRICYG